MSSFRFLSLSSFLDRTQLRGDSDRRSTHQYEYQKAEHILKPTNDNLSSQGSKEAKRLINRRGKSVKRKPSAAQLHRNRSRASLRLTPTGTRPTPSSRQHYNLATVAEDRASAESHAHLKVASIETLAFSMSESHLAKISSEELVRIVLRLRKEVLQLRKKEYDAPEESNRNEISIQDPKRNFQLENDIILARQEIRRIEEELQEKKLRLAESEKARKEALNALALVTVVDRSSFDDKYFLDKVQKLRYNVTRWVRNQQWKVPQGNAGGRRNNKIGAKDFQFMDTTCPNYRHCLASLNGVRSLVEAHIWQNLVNEVFGHNIWAVSGDEMLGGPKGFAENPYTVWKSHLGQTVQDDDLKHSWRVATARLMAARKSESVDRAITMAIRELVVDFCEQLQRIAEKEVDLGNFEMFMKDAVQLDWEIQQQRPLYHFRPIWRRDNWELQFSPKYMEIDGDDGRNPLEKYNGLAVKLILQPSFQKWGNAAGRSYRSGNTILKMVVELDEPLGNDVN